MDEMIINRIMIFYIMQEYITTSGGNGVVT